MERFARRTGTNWCLTGRITCNWRRSPEEAQPQKLTRPIMQAANPGLCCARHLQEQGVRFKILEASEGIGGRQKRCWRTWQVRDRVEGEGKEYLRWETMRARCALLRCRER